MSATFCRTSAILTVCHFVALGSALRAELSYSPLGASSSESISIVTFVEGKEKVKEIHVELWIGRIKAVDFSDGLPEGLPKRENGSVEYINHKCTKAEISGRKCEYHLQIPTKL